ncbi:MAG: 50S ribosomal protein L11 methyltransferase [Clostridia bacterium]|nr:50S ribosomal protein L11 methyltransferase [Clostridia bacterium]
MYKEIIVVTTSAASDSIADVMWSLGATGVKVLDPKDLDFVLNSDTCWDYVEDNLLKQPDVVKVSYFVEDNELDEQISMLKEAIAPYEKKYGDMQILVEDVPEVDWEEEWKNFYKPLTAGKYTILAEWLDDEGYEDTTIIKINPSKAFGTGEHASTRLCLTLMSGIDFSGKTVIDVGAGSGILGIGAAKSGAVKVDMCDIDVETLQCAEENSDLNGVKDKVALTAGGVDAIPGKKVDVILANLTADILEKIVNDVAKYAKEGTIMISSGILDTRVDDLLNIYQAHGFKLLSRIDEGEWVGVKFVYGT